MHFYTKEQLDFLRKYYPKHSRKELHKLFNEHFDLNVSLNSIVACLKNHNIKSGRTGRFEKGCVPVNKGTKGMFNVGGNRTSFKKGQRPKNYKPVGTERVDRDGYVLVKVQDDGPWHHRWKLKHKLIWENAYGPIPKGHAILFADGNKQNLNLDNLILVSRSQLAMLNKYDLIKEHADLTKIGIKIADLHLKIGERKKEK